MFNRIFLTKTNVYLGSNKVSLGIMQVRYVIEALKFHGWKLVRWNGDHRQFRNSENPFVVTVAGHLKDVVPVGTLKNIERRSGLQF